MKTIYLLPILLLVVSSCKDDEEARPSIVGTWQGDRADVQVNYGIIPVYDETDEQFNITIRFNEDGTVILTRDGIETNGTYTLSGDKLTTDADLQVYGVSGPTTFDVATLTEEKLDLRLNDKREVNVPDYGNVEVTIIASLKFDRI